MKTKNLNQKQLAELAKVRQVVTMKGGKQKFNYEPKKQIVL